MDKADGGNRRKIIIISVIAAVVIVAAVTVLFIFLGNPGNESFSSISVSEIVGDVTVENNGDVYKAYPNMHLTDGFAMTTAGASYSRMSLDDAKFVKLEELSRAKFEAMGSGGKSMSILLEYGELSNEISRPLAVGEEYTVTTPNAVLSVRGTLFITRARKDDEGKWLTDVFTFGGSVSSHRILPDGTPVDEDIRVNSGYKATIKMDDETTYYIEETDDDPGDNVDPIELEDIDTDILVDVYAAAKSGHDVCFTQEQLEETFEKRGVDITQYTSYRTGEPLSTGNDASGTESTPTSTDAPDSMKSEDTSVSEEIGTSDTEESEEISDSGITTSVISYVPVITSDGSDDTTQAPVPVTSISDTGADPVTVTTTVSAATTTAGSVTQSSAPETSIVSEDEETTTESGTTFGETTTEPTETEETTVTTTAESTAEPTASGTSETTSAATTVPSYIVPITTTTTTVTTTTQTTTETPIPSDLLTCPYCGKETSEWSVEISDADCTHTGIKHLICPNCNKIVEDITIPATGIHSYGAGETIQPHWSLATGSSSTLMAVMDEPVSSTLTLSLTVTQHCLVCSAEATVVENVLCHPNEDGLIAYTFTGLDGGEHTVSTSASLWETEECEHIFGLKNITHISGQYSDAVFEGTLVCSNCELPITVPGTVTGFATMSDGSIKYYVDFVYDGETWSDTYVDESTASCTHDYSGYSESNPPDFDWSADHTSCTAIFDCLNGCGAYEEVTCEVQISDLGTSIEYKALCSFNGKTFTGYYYEPRS